MTLCKASDHALRPSAVIKSLEPTDSVGLLQLLICDNAGQKQVPDANQRKTHSPDDITGQGVKVYFIGQKQIKKNNYSKLNP